jgi:N-ethylmaleimide reductase
MSQRQLFTPVALGAFEIKNRIVLAPMTRSRATPDGIQTPLAVTYYRQRATGGLLITEATAVSKQGSGYPVIPGMWNADQAASWKSVTEAVHAEGGIIFMQLFHTGRIGHSSLYGEQPVAPSAIRPEGQVMTAAFEMVDYETPRALGTEEIPGIVEQFRHAAEQAKTAGFDGIEIHSANGYILDQFLKDGSNQRTDQYGGSVENRLRLLLEVVGAIVGVWGADRVGVRISPHSIGDSDPKALAVAIAQALNPIGLAYLHVLDPVDGPNWLVPTIRQAYNGKLIANAGYTAELAERDLANGTADAIAFGVKFLANPDLAARIAENAPLNQPDQATFYGGDEKGYTDYPTLEKAGV